MSEGRRCPVCGRHFAFPGLDTEPRYRILAVGESLEAGEVLYIEKCGARLAVRHVDRAPEVHRLGIGK